MSPGASKVPGWKRAVLPALRASGWGPAVPPGIAGRKSKKMRFAILH